MGNGTSEELRIKQGSLSVDAAQEKSRVWLSIVCAAHVHYRECNYVQYTYMMHINGLFLCPKLSSR